MRLAAAVLLLVATTSAHATRLEFAGKVPSLPGGLEHIRQIGDARYLALSTLSADRELGVLDLETATALVVTPQRLERVAHTSDIDAELVSYTPERVGLHLTDGTLERAAHHWYVELDAKGRRLRSVELGAFDDRVELVFVGTDPDRGAVWFAALRYDEHLTADFAHVHGPREAVLRKLDQSSLAVTDVITIALPAREMTTGYEDHLMFHHAGDFSRFAVVEYDERSFKTRPPAQVYIVDPEQQTWFAVPALATTYGVAFTPAYIYLASAQVGTIARVDVAKQRIDKTVRGPLLTHDLVVARDRLVVIGTSKKYTVCTLPALACAAQPHVAEVAAGAAELSGGGKASRDGRYYVLPAALAVRAGSAPVAPREILITRVVD